MRIIPLILFLFLLSSFSIGSSIEKEDFTSISKIIENASISTTDELSKTFSSIENDNLFVDGIFKIIKEFGDFIMVSLFQSMKMGIQFGMENPDYFEASFIFKIIKLIFWLIIISLLIKPVFYILIFGVLFVIFVKDKIIKKSNFGGKK